MSNSQSPINSDSSLKSTLPENSGKQQKSTTRPTLIWTILHWLAIGAVITSLLTGFRIASVFRSELLYFSFILPQGSLHQWHIIAGVVLVSLYIAYPFYLFTRRSPEKSKKLDYHRFVTWFGYLVFTVSLISGITLYLDAFGNVLAPVHYWSAVGWLVYIAAHALIYIIQYGSKLFAHLLIPSISSNAKSLKMATLLIIFFTVALLFFYSLSQSDVSKHRLIVHSIDISEFISIDGLAEERAWQQANTLKIPLRYGANFKNNESQAELKAIKNTQEIFFLIKWYDPTESRKHLPLLKTAEGWKVQGKGFYQFDETEFYEDKLAVMLSNECAPFADNTAHLGAKPLANKPANWHGKGYHYAHDGKVRDLWHWKAVRTNDMYLADDNFFGVPDDVRPGARRYTAGYQPDGKESGAYIANWQWYRPTTVTPKRLPQSHVELPSSDDSNQWVGTWFDYTAYQPQNDHYAIGSELPSILYRSNRFEGDRADVRARAVWQDNYWTLELVRKLSTGSKNDVVIQEGTCVWVAPFDHSQIAHARHAQPAKLEFLP